MLSLLDIKNEVTKQAKKAGITSRVPNWLYAVESHALSGRPYWFMVKKATLTAESGKALYILDSRVDGQRISKFNNITDDFHVTLEDIAQMLWKDPTPDEGGQPYSYAYQGLSRVQDQPDAASKLTLVSSNSNDKGKKVFVAGHVNGIYVEEEVQLDPTDGTSSVQTANTYDADGVETVEIEPGKVGTLTVTADSGATTIVSIPPSVNFIEAPRIRFNYVPDEALELDYYFYQKVQKITSDFKHPIIPEQFHWDICMNGVLAIAYYNNNDFDQARLFEAKMEQGIRRMTNWSNPTGKSPHKSGPNRPLISKFERFDFDEVDGVGTP